MANVYNSQLVRFIAYLDQFNYSADFSHEDAFELYHKIQEENNTYTPGIGLPAFGHALAGSAGTAISHIILYPLSLAITRLQVQRQLRGPSETPSAASEADVEYKNLQDAIEKIYKNEGGLQGFYTGCLTDTSKSVVDAFLFFLTYTFLRRRQQTKNGSKSLPIIQELSIGIASGAFAKLVTTPIQQIVTRKQTAAMVAARDPTSSITADHADKLSIKDIALQIRSERGIQGFWAGYSASLILTLNPALTFLLHDLLKKTLLPKSKRESPGSTLVFLLAAISKAAASTITYPFSLAKTRAQVSTSSSSVSSSEKAVSEQTSTNTPPEFIEKPSSAETNTSPTNKSTYATVSEQSRRTLRILYTNLSAQTSVLRSVHAIYKTEGLAALYSGLSGEVLKGFLGHGLTMLLKERIHVFVISAYYQLLRITKRLPDDFEDVRGRAGAGLGRARDGVGDFAQEVGTRVENVTVTVKEGVEYAVTGGDKE